MQKESAASQFRSQGWQAKPGVIARMKARQPAVIYDEAEVPAYTLPELMVCADGTHVSGAPLWESKRRQEILELFREHVYGRSPGKPAGIDFERAADQPIADGRTMLRRVKIRCAQADKAFEFSLAILLPPDHPRPLSTFLFINNRPPDVADPTRARRTDFWAAEDILARGYAAAVFYVGEVEPDENAEPPGAGVRTVFASPGKPGADGWGTISAWAWAACRAMDYLQSDDDINAQQVALVGHSRGGKTALWAGAQDSRFSLVVSNNSGGTGAALARRRYGETIAAINSIFPNWFCGNYRKYNDNEAGLPVDQHQLLSLIAPRPLYVVSADEDLWADPRGEFLSLVHASQAYALYFRDTFENEPMPPLDTPVVHGAMAYHVRSGTHDLTRYDWAQYLNFADRIWSTRSAPAMTGCANQHSGRAPRAS